MEGNTHCKIVAGLLPGPASPRIEHPYVAGLCLEFKDDLVTGHGHGSVHAKRRAVEMMERERGSNRLLGGQIEALRPETKVAVPLGIEIEQVAIRRPARHPIGSGTVRNLNPLLFRGR